MVLGISGTATITTPSGWTQRAHVTIGSQRLGVYTKIWAGTEGASVNVTLSAGMRGNAFVFEIQKPGVLSFGTTATNSGSATVSFNAINPGSSADRIWIGIAAIRDTGGGSVTPSSGYTVLRNGNFNDTLTLVEYIRKTASSETPPAMTHTFSTAWCSFGMAVTSI